MTRTQKTRLYSMRWLLGVLVFSIAVGAHGPANGPSRTDSNDFEEQIATLMKQAPGQRRASLTPNPILARIARERAQDMARRNYFGHVNPDGFGANYLVTQAGYLLPKNYSKKKSANHIETIASGNQTPADAWAAWMGSSGHKKHLLGETKAYAEQTDFGVGYAYLAESQWKHYWVVITAKPGDPLKDKKK